MPQELIGPATRAPSTHDILDVWRADGRVHEAASVVYLQHIRRFRVYCAQYALKERDELTQEGARRTLISGSYGRHHGVGQVD